jgi:hypothetical protein
MTTAAFLSLACPSIISSMKWLVQSRSGTLSYFFFKERIIIRVFSPSLEISFSISTIDNSKYTTAMTLLLLDLKAEFKWSTALQGGWAERRRK